MYVGIDDTDSTNGMCTTYISAKLCKKLGTLGLPKLVRLNPNIPYKTRGNGAVSFKTTHPKAKEKILSYVRKHSTLSDENTNPGVVFLDSEEVPPPLYDFYRKAVSEIVSIKEAENTAAKVGAVTHKFKNGRGIIGALAAIGFSGEKTYEILAYRKPENYSTPRRINRQSVIEMNNKLYPRTFDNIDSKGRRVLITPRGKDPIFCGIRGIDFEAVTAAWEMVEPLEPIELTQVFETNQATDAHLRHKKIAEINPYDCVIVSGEVKSKPSIISGGHVVFSLSDGTGEIDCAAYRPSGVFRGYVRQLLPGDTVEVSGGIGRYNRTINLEKLKVISLTEQQYTKTPLCCGKNMSSAGKNKGYKCKKCGKKISQAECKVSQKLRLLGVGIYEPPPGSRRHLSKPLSLQLRQN